MNFAGRMRARRKRRAMEAGHEPGVCLRLSCGHAVATERYCSRWCAETTLYDLADEWDSWGVSTRPKRTPAEAFADTFRREYMGEWPPTDAETLVTQDAIDELTTALSMSGNHGDTPLRTESIESTMREVRFDPEVKLF